MLSLVFICVVCSLYTNLYKGREVLLLVRPYFNRSGESLVRESDSLFRYTQLYEELGHLLYIKYSVLEQLLRLHRTLSLKPFRELLSLSMKPLLNFWFYFSSINGFFANNFRRTNKIKFLTYAGKNKIPDIPLKEVGLLFENAG